MTFHLDKEIETTQKTLEKLKDFLSRGAEQLRVAEDFAGRCADLQIGLQQMAAVVPPKEPVPETLPVTLQVPTQELRPATRLERWQWKKADVDGNVVQVVDEEHVVAVIDPRWPGPGAPSEIEVPIEVSEFERVPVGRSFRYQERRVRRLVKVPLSSLPQDAAYLRRLKELYAQRKAELNREVADINDFLARRQAEVASQEQQTAKLQADTDALVRQVAALPTPPDAAGDLQAIEQRIQALRQEVVAVGKQVSSNEETLQQLKKTAKALCRELPL